MERCAICGEINKTGKYDSSGFCVSCHSKNIRETYHLNDFDIEAQKFIKGKSEIRIKFKDRFQALEI